MTKKHSKKRLHWWAHSSPASELNHGQKPDHPARLRDSLHMLRDGPGALQMSALLADDHALDRIFLNLPAGAYTSQTDGPPLEKYAEIPADDLVLLTTRPALDDDPEFDKRALPRTGSVLEVMVHKGLRRFFGFCSRSMVILSDEVADECSSAQLDHRAIKFRVFNDAHCVARGNFSTTTKLEAAQRQSKYQVGEAYATNGYLAFLPALEREDGSPGPGLVSSFGMNGTGSLLWTHLLFTEKPLLVRDLVRGDKPRLIVGEFEARFPDDLRPSSIAFSRKQNLRMILDVELS